MLGGGDRRAVRLGRLAAPLDRRRRAHRAAHRAQPDGRQRPGVQRRRAGRGQHLDGLDLPDPAGRLGGRTGAAGVRGAGAVAGAQRRRGGAGDARRGPAVRAQPGRPQRAAAAGRRAGLHRDPAGPRLRHLRPGDRAGAGLHRAALVDDGVLVAAVAPAGARPGRPDRPGRRAPRRGLHRGGLRGRRRQRAGPPGTRPARRAGAAAAVHRRTRLASPGGGFRRRRPAAGRLPDLPDGLLRDAGAQPGRRQGRLRLEVVAGADLPGQLQRPVPAVDPGGAAGRHRPGAAGGAQPVLVGAPRRPARRVLADPHAAGAAGRRRGVRRRRPDPGRVLGAPGRGLHARPGAAAADVLHAGPAGGDPRRGADRPRGLPGGRLPAGRRDHRAVDGAGRLGGVGGQLAGAGPRRHLGHRFRHRRRAPVLLPGHRARAPADRRRLPGLSADAGGAGRHQQHPRGCAAAAVGQLRPVGRGAGHPAAAAAAGQRPGPAEPAAHGVLHQHGHAGDEHRPQRPGDRPDRADQPADHAHPACRARPDRPRQGAVPGLGGRRGSVPQGAALHPDLSGRGLDRPGRRGAGLPGDRRDADRDPGPDGPAPVPVEPAARRGVHQLPHRPGARVRAGPVRAADPAAARRAVYRAARHRSETPVAVPGAGTVSAWLAPATNPGANAT